VLLVQAQAEKQKGQQAAAQAAAAQAAAAAAAQAAVPQAIPVAQAPAGLWTAGPHGMGVYPVPAGYFSQAQVQPQPQPMLYSIAPPAYPSVGAPQATPMMYTAAPGQIPVAYMQLPPGYQTGPSQTHPRDPPPPYPSRK
jgi:hypothetical protein